MGQNLSSEQRESEVFVFVRKNCCEKCAENLVSRGFKSADVLTDVNENDLQEYGIKDGHLKNLLRAIKKLSESGTETLQEVSQEVTSPSALSQPLHDNSQQQKTSKSFDVMLSYQWSHQKEVIRIRDALRSRGISVWIDVEQMNGNIYEAMREAIMSSSVIVCCLTQKYECSDNCKRELYYTAGLRNPSKHVVPIRLDNGPFTWTEFVTAGKLYIDFGNAPAADWESMIDALVNEILAHTSKNPPEPSTLPIPPPPSTAFDATPNQSLLKTWLKPEGVEMDNEIEEIYRKQLPGTREWLYADIDNFTNSETERVFWIKGVAGVGKSVVSAVVCNRLQNLNKCGGYFFCKHNNSSRNQPQRIILTLCYHLSQQFPEFENAVNELRQSQEDFLEKANTNNYFKRLIVEPLKKVSADQQRPVVVIIDALDECGAISSPERKSLINLLANWSEVPYFVKLLITSRPESDIQNILKPSFKAHEIDLNHDLQRKDLLLFSKSRLKQLKDRMGISTEQLEDLAVKLAAKANGLFIWLSLAVDEICHEDSDSLSVLEGLLSERNSQNNDHQMDEMYISTLDRATRGKSSSFVESLARIVAAIVVVGVPVSDDCLAKLYGVTLGDVRVKLSSIRSLLNITDNTIQVLHKSFADFLQSPSRCTDSRFLIDVTATNEYLALRSLELMNSGLYFNIGGYDSKDLCSSTTSKPEEYLEYSSKHWISHLISSGAENIPNKIKSSFDTFCATHLLHWIEVLSILDSISVAQVELPRLLPFVKNDRIANLLRDASRFANEFRIPITESPLHIYYSALAMCPDDTALSREYSARFKDYTHQVVAGKERDWSLCLATYEGHEASVNGVAWWQSKDGESSLIASASHDETVRLWDAFTGVEIRKLCGHSDRVNCVAFSIDGKYLASGSKDKSIRLWDVNSVKETLILNGHDGIIYSVAFSPSGRTIASGSYDKIIKLWDLESGSCFKTLIGHTNWVQSVSFSPDGKTIVSGSHDKTIKTWDLESGSCTNTFTGHTGSIQSVVFSLEGNILASGSDDNTIKIWNFTTGLCLKTLADHSYSVQSVAFSHDGKILASGSSDNTIKIWNLGTGLCTTTFMGHTLTVWGLVFSPNGETLASGSSDKTIKIWNLKSGKNTTSAFAGQSNWVQSAVFSHDEKVVASGFVDGAIKIWDAVTGICTNTLTGHTESVRSVAFAPDDKILASGSVDETIKLWDVKSGLCVKTLIGHVGAVQSLAYSSDGKMIASGSVDELVKIWNLRNGTCTNDLSGHESQVQSVKFSPDCKTLTSTDLSGVSKVWNLNTGEEINADLDSFFSDQSLKVSGNGWILRSGTKIFWLPNYARGRTVCEPSSGKSIAIGNAEGRVTIIKFAAII